MPRRWPWVLAAAVMVAGGAGWWWRAAPADAQAPSGAPGATPWLAGASGGAAKAATSGAPLIPRAPVTDARPADFSEADWAALNKAVATEHDPAKERQRLVSYLRFQRATAQWSALKDGPDVVQRQALGREILELMPQHVAQGELNTGEATLLLNALAQDVSSDAAERKAWIQAQMQSLASQHDPEQDRALAEEQRKNADFARQQAEIVAKWRSGGQGDGDPATLEAQLQALRERVYGSGNGK